MKNEHAIGQFFNYTTLSDNNTFRLVAREAEPNVACKCEYCFFGSLQNTGYCSGHPVFEWICKEHKCGRNPKCTPECRADGKNVVYKVRR